MFEILEKINERPEPFAVYTAADLWTDAYTSERMLLFHLDEDSDVSSRNMRFINRSVQWILSRFKVGSGTTIADFGCGPGLYCGMLARLGARVTGVDFSERSLSYARECAAAEGLDIHYVLHNYLTFETPDRFDLLLMIMCDFCALSPSQRNTLLGTFHKILKPGGSLLLDVYATAAFNQRKEAATYEANLLDGFWAPGAYYGFLNTFKYDEERVILDKYTIVEPHRVRTVYNWLQYFTPDTLKKEFTASGFFIEEVLSDVAGNPFDPEASEFAVIAKRAHDPARHPQ